LTFLHRAEPGERFARTAWDNQIGKTVPFNIGERRIRYRCILIAAEVSEDGSSVQLTIETDDVTPAFDPVSLRELPGLSFDFTPIPAAEPPHNERSDWEWR